jgi:hypothetical protein
MDLSYLVFRIGLLLYGYLIGHLSSKRYFRLKKTNTKLKIKDYILLLISVILVVPGLIPFAGFLLGWFTNKSIIRIKKL